MTIRQRLGGLARRAAAARGFELVRRSEHQVVPRNFYSPIPDYDALPDDIWDRRTALRGVAFDTAEQIAWAERELADYVRELEAPRTGDPADKRFFFENRTYEYGDAEIAYAMVRRFRPACILELGSGWSTHSLALACLANEQEGDPARLVTNDPFPRGFVDTTVPGVTRFVERPAQEVPIAEFEALGENDILFVDTTHVVKMGGDVNYVVLEALPALRPGVLVHFHDIWLPDEYHRALTEILGMHWTEQYLLQAFLAHNRDFEVLFATHAVATRQAERFEALVPGYTGANYPSGFWLRRSSSST